MLRIGGAGAPRRAVRPIVGPPTPSLNQSGEEPANETPGGQDPKFERRVVRWLLDSDPSIRWQVMCDLAEDPDEPVAAERMTGMRARAVAGFAMRPVRPFGRI